MTDAKLADAAAALGEAQDAAGVAHDLNNFLAAVIGAAETLLRRGPFDTATQADLANIRASAQAAATLAHRLLDDSSGEPEPGVAALDAALHEIAAQVRYTLPQGVSLTVETAATAAAVAMPKLALQRVLTNLTANAVKAMPNGGTLTLRSAQVSAPARRSWRGGAIPRGAYVQIDVCDTGGGIAPDVLPRVFDRHFTTRRGQGGHGLGLAAVDTLVRQSGGFIAIDSRVGEGTQVSLCFPLPPAAPLPGGAVLLVDDDEIVLRHTARALRDAGWQVITAGSAEEALDKLPPPPRVLAAVVTDLLLPGDSGGALIASLRQRLARPDLPAVVLSGISTQRARHAVAQATGSAAGLRVLAKPCDARDLAAAVQALAQPR